MCTYFFKSRRIFDLENEMARTFFGVATLLVKEEKKSAKSIKNGAAALKMEFVNYDTVRNLFKFYFFGVFILFL